MTVTLEAGADPRILVPGDPGAARATAADLRTRAEACEVAAHRLARIETAEAWQGVAGERFRAALGTMPRRLRVAADAHARVARAITGYADTLEQAQGTAADAIALWQEGRQQSARSRTEHDRAVARAEVQARVLGTGPARITLAPVTDPGTATRAQAVTLLTSARRTVEITGDHAAEIVREAADTAPDGPGLWDQAGGVWSEVWHGGADLGADVADAIASFGNALAQNPDIVLELIAGAAMMVGGEALMAGGLALDATGVGAVVGVPANVLAAGLIAAGAGTVVHGGLRAANEAAGDSAVEPFHGPSRGGSGWRSPDAMPENPPTRVTGYR
ncbi:MAG TPA: hypothetical protein VGC57_01485, partial [Cellulomonas sp.]